jgi:outer membrane protein OmpU
VRAGRPTLAVLAATAAPWEAAGAAEALAGGALEVTVSGFAAFQAHAGALDDQRADPELATGLDFSNDTEVHVVVRGKHDATGVEYGGTVELEADTNGGEAAGESWVFARGGFGELRFGDEDGAVDNSAVGGFTVAAGTGGIDGEVIDALEVDAVLPTNSGEATKIRYYTPSLGGLQAGVSYTPSDDDGGDTLAARGVDVRDWVEAALAYEGEAGEEAEVEASVVGSLADDGGGARPGWAWFAGAAAEVGGVEVGAGFGDEDVDGEAKRYVNAGAALGLGPARVSVTYGRVLDTDGYDGVGRPWNLALSADGEPLEGVILAGDLVYFDNDLDRDARRETGGDSGWVWLARLEVVF